MNDELNERLASIESKLDQFTEVIQTIESVVTEYLPQIEKAVERIMDHPMIRTLFGGKGLG